MKHITIDLDFFLMSGMQPGYYKARLPQCLEVINTVQCSNKPCTVVASHEDILPFINTEKYDTIINVDFHSDIGIQKISEQYAVNEGSWANFYKYREDACFEWRYPDFEKCVKQKWGRCDGWDLGMIVTNRMPYERYGWKTIKRKQGITIDTLRSADSYTICLSESWCDADFYKTVVRLFTLEEMIKKVGYQRGI